MMPRTPRARGRRLSLAAALALITSCGYGYSQNACPAHDGPDLASGAVAPPGLLLKSVLGYVTVSDGPHAHGIVVDDDYAILGSSSDAPGLGVVQLSSDGCLSMASALGATPSVGRCTALALHPASRTLFCSAGDGWPVVSFDVTEPGKPVLRSQNVLTTQLGAQPGYPTITVAGSTLYLAHFEGGLLSAQIAPDGSLAPPSVAVAGDVLEVASDGADLALLDQAKGLVTFSVADGALTPTGALPLPGPPIAVSVTQGVATVAMGSAGALVARLTPSGPVTVAQVSPPCVAVTTAVSGNALAVGCLTGVYLYELGAAPRVAGYYAAHYGVMDVLFSGGDLLVNDWWRMVRLQVNPEGHELAPDAPLSLYVNPTSDAHFQVRNPGDVLLHVSPSLQVSGNVVSSTALTPFVVPANGDVTMTVTQSQLTPLSGESNGGTIYFDVQEAGSHPSDPTPPSTLVARRRSGPRNSQEAPGIGDSFPTMSVSQANIVPVLVPTPATMTYFDFLQSDCVLQWPEAQDLSWLTTQGLVPGHAQVMLMDLSAVADPQQWVTNGFIANWSLQNVPIALFGLYYQSLPGEMGSSGSMYDAFYNFDVPSIETADNPHIFMIDQSSTVLSYERIYRGRWSLFGPY